MTSVTHRAASDDKPAAARVTLSVEGPLAVELAKIATDADQLRQENQRLRKALAAVEQDRDRWHRAWNAQATWRTAPTTSTTRRRWFR